MLHGRYILTVSRLLLKKSNAASINKHIQKFQQSNLISAKRLEILRRMAVPQARADPVIMKLDSADFQSIFSEELNSLAEIFKEYGHEIRIAGGAVRDLLMGVRPSDLDFATTATPEQMKEMFTAKNVRMINMNGEKHGTITPRINDKENFEVTTLRIDVVTDGRRAEVQFTTDWLLDAMRRDLTINSMFLSLDGSVYDYFYGYEDLKNHHVRFVGDPATRIQEDYLRILRYFRFFGKISKDPNKHDEDTLKAICENRDGLSIISGERIWVELRRILEGNFASEMLQKIIECDLGPFIGLPANPNVEELKLVTSRNPAIKLHPITLLCTLMNNEDDAVMLNLRLKLSAFDRDLALFVVQHRQVKPDVRPLLPYQKLVVKSKSRITDSFRFVVEVLKYQNSPHLEDFQKWIVPKFPVSGKMLKDHGVDGGKFMGLILTELKHRWVEDEFKTTPEELLKQVPEVLDILAQKRRNK